MLRDPLSVTWIGHSTFLVRLDGTTILTDPVFGPRVGILLAGAITVGKPRLVPPALPMRDLPPVDLALVSHAHMDHYDLASLRRLERDVPVVFAKDTTEFIEGFDFTNIAELDWHQSVEVKGVRIEAIPVRHWGKRYPWDRARGYNGYLVSKGRHAIFFAGDTAETDVVGARLGGRRLDAAFFPVGSYNPWTFAHANPEEAWHMFRALDARYFVPMHWRTFKLSQEATFEPIQRLWAVAGSLRDRITLDHIGQTWSLTT